MIKIDCDIIRVLREQGKHLEATQLLDAYYQSLKRDKFMLNSVIRRSQYHERVDNGMCAVEGCYKPQILNKTLCNHHLIEGRVRSRKYIYKK